MVTTSSGNILPMAISRRELLRLAVSGGVFFAHHRAWAIGEGSLFRFGQLTFGASWNPHPTALARMAWEIDKRTSISVETEPRRQSGEGEVLHETPFLYLAGDREFALPSAGVIEQLRRFLTFGGFLLIDSAEGSVRGAFDGSVRRLIKAVFPTPHPGLSLVPADHVLYKSFYLVNRPVGRLSLSGAIEGVTRGDNLSVAYVQNDLGGAWARDNLGNYAFSCEPGGEAQREQAFRFGINLVMYSLCLSYKSDQVHVEALRKRRRWLPNDGAESP
jgi:hypothetical protein